MMLEIGTARFLLDLICQQLLIGTALVVFVHLCLRSRTRWNAATRHWIWVLTLLAVALLPLSAVLPGQSAVTLTSAAPSIGQSGNPGSAADSAFREPGAQRVLPARSAPDIAALSPTVVRGLATATSVLWVLGSLWMLFRLFESACVATRLRRESRPASISGAEAEIRVSALARSPMVVGLRRPSILVPAFLLEQVSHDELRRVLEHELAHLRRGDQWIALMQRLIQALYFYHPGIRFAAARLEDEREISCDDRAAADHRAGYADSLVRIGRTIVTGPSTPPLAVGAVRSRTQLGRRITHLLDGTRNHAPDVSAAGLACGAMVLIAAAAGASQLMPRLAIASDLPAAEQRYDGSAHRYFGMPLIAAAARGNLQAVQEMILAGADPNAEVPGDGTPLIVASRAGHLELVEWLLDHGADANTSVRGDGNPLIVAAAHGHTGAMRLLLDRGADIDAIVPGDETALISAARGGTLGSVRLLLERGADVNIAVPVARYDGTPEVRTALNQAQANGYDEIAGMLVAHGALR